MSSSVSRGNKKITWEADQRSRESRSQLSSKVAQSSGKSKLAEEKLVLFTPEMVGRMKAKEFKMDSEQYANLMKGLQVMSFEKVLMADHMSDADILGEFQKLAEGKTSTLQPRAAEDSSEVSGTPSQKNNPITKGTAKPATGSATIKERPIQAPKRAPTANLYLERSKEKDRSRSRSRETSLDGGSPYKSLVSYNNLSSLSRRLGDP